MTDRVTYFFNKYNLVVCFLILTLSASLAHARRSTVIDSCNFGCAADTTLVTSSSVICQTPSGSSAWVEDQDTCTGTHTCITATTNARASSGYTNCILMTRPPTSPGISTYNVQITMTESGTTGATVCQGIYARYTDSTHYYSFMVCDDVTTSGFARLYLQNGTLYTGTTSLGTAAGFGQNYNSVVTFKVYNDVKLILKDGASLISSTDNTLTGTGTAGVVCGQAQVSGDDCGTTVFFDNFSVIEVARRVRTAWLPDFITTASAASMPDDMVRAGRWYVSPLVFVDGVWQPKIETIESAQCATSNVINPATSDIVLSYVNCGNYDELEKDPEIQFIYDEAKKPLDKEARMMLERIGKPIDANFNPLGTWAR